MIEETQELFSDNKRDDGYLADDTRGKDMSIGDFQIKYPYLYLLTYERGKAAGREYQRKLQREKDSAKRQSRTPSAIGR